MNPEDMGLGFDDLSSELLDLDLSDVCGGESSDFRDFEELDEFSYGE